MLFGKLVRKCRRGRNVVMYHADNSDDRCKEAEGTMFNDWISYLENICSVKSDITVYVENQPYYLHLTVLTFWSTYFEEIMRDSSTDIHRATDKSIVTCANVNKAGFDIVLGFMYHRKLFLDEDNVGNVLAVANDLKIISIVKCCCNYIVANLRRLGPLMADIVEFLCSPKNQYSSKIIMPQLIKRWDIFQSNEVLRRIPFEFFEVMITSNKIPGYNDKDLIGVCSKWISVDFSHRYWYIVDLVESIVGKSNLPWMFDRNRFPPKNMDEVERIFDDLLHSCIEDEKIDFVNYFKLVIKKGQNHTNDQMIDDQNLPMILPVQFYFKEWCHQMSTLRHRTNTCDITIRVNTGEQYMLDHWILRLTSQYFKKLETNSVEIVQLDLTAQEFTSVLNFMYGKVLHINPNNIYDIIRASRYLMMISCKKLIIKFIRKNYTLLDMLELLNISSEEPDLIYDAMKRRMTRNSSKPRIELKKKYSKSVTRNRYDVSKFGRPFVIKMPRIDYTYEYPKIKVVQEKLQFGKPLCIKVPRLKI